MRRAYQDYTMQLERAIELFKTKLGSILASTAILTPELRDWALQQATDEEIVAGFKEVREGRKRARRGDPKTQAKAAGS